MDKSVEYIPVLMVNPAPANYPRYELPAGYAFSDDFADFRTSWVRVALSSGLVEGAENAEKVFDGEFGNAPSLWPERFAYVVDGSGHPVGIAALWDDEKMFGRPLRKFHWVGVDEAHARKGIARAMLSKLMDLNAAYKDGTPLFLESQTSRYDALNLYTKFGFRPYMGATPPAWEGLSDAADRLGRAWTIVEGKFAEYGVKLPQPVTSLDNKES